jgi:hypothetical protein
MTEPTPHDPSAAAEVRQILQLIAELLDEAPHLGPEAQRLLAALIHELSESLNAGTVPPPELTQIAEHVRALVRAAQAGENQGLRDRLELAVTSVEARAPLVAGLTRRLLETLAEMGI